MTRPTAPRLRRTALAAVLALGVLATPQSAFGAANAVVKDCAEDGSLSKTYTAAEYASALKNIPTDVDEYTDCRDVIRRAQLGGSGSGSGSGGSGGGATTGGSGGGGTTSGGTPVGGTGDPSGGASAGGTTAGGGLGDYEAAVNAATPEERSAIDAAKSGGAVEGASLDGAAFDSGSSSDNGIPGPLVLVLVLMALGTLAAAAPKLRTLVRTRI